MSDNSDEMVPEEQKMTDIKHEGIYVRKIITSETDRHGKKKKECRVYNSRHSCIYCHLLHSNIAEHFLCIHKTRQAVKEVMEIVVDPTDDPAIKKTKQTKRNKLLD